MGMGFKVLLLFIGMAVMFCSALLFQIKTDAELGKQQISDGLIVPEGTNPKRNSKLGIAFALFAGVCFGISALLNSIVTRPAIVGDKFTFSQLLYHSASLIVFSALVYLVTGNRSDKNSTMKQRFSDIFIVNRKTWLPFTAGAMFMVATLLTIFSYRMIPNAVAWSITQLNVFWTILVGIFFFKEINYKRHWLRLTAGVIMAIGACVLLFFAI
jgi:glucose uptake protein GlcU